MAEYPLPKFHFSVDWGDEKFAFSEVSRKHVENENIQ
jgi:hypothetical protein